MASKICPCGSEKKPPAPGTVIIWRWQTLTQELAKSDKTGYPFFQWVPEFQMATDYFCKQPPTAWHRPEITQQDKNFNTVIDRKWADHCRCKYPCPKPGNCEVRYKVFGQMSTKYYDWIGQLHEGGKLGLYAELVGPIGTVRIDPPLEVQLGNGSGSYTVWITAGKPAQEIGIASGNYNVYGYRYAPIITRVERIDNLPDECSPPKQPNDPPPPFPLYPIPIVIGGDPPPPPPPPPPCPPCICKEPPPPPPPPEPEPPIIAKPPTPPPPPKPVPPIIYTPPEIKIPIPVIPDIIPVPPPPPPVPPTPPEPPCVTECKFQFDQDLRRYAQRILAILEKVESFVLTAPTCDGGSQTISVSGRALDFLPKAFQALNDLDQQHFKDACTTQKLAERTYRILGGNEWYKRGEQQKVPEYDAAIESMLKAVGSIQGFGSEREDVSITSFNLPQLLYAVASVLYHRTGLQEFPAELPPSLLTYTDGEAAVKKLSLTQYVTWIVEQFDALVGQFPIEIQIEDIDPSTQGSQTKTIELPNLSEALAEMYGLSIQSSVNSDISINFLMRLAAELIATKNAVLVTQDYSKANASFMGYKGNPKARKIDYNFNPEKLDSLDQFLQRYEGYITGWEETDKDTIVGYLQRLAFAAGIIKATFMRTGKQSKQLEDELNSMTEKEKDAAEKEWEAILRWLNNPDSLFNKDSEAKPQVRDKEDQS